MGGPGSGGARRNSGPPPDPNALRRQRDGKEWTHLPSRGRLDPAPEWPDEVPEATPEELLLWRRLWQKPQALVWEADHAADVVAFYVRTYLEAMQPRAGAMARTFAKQLAGELYLTPPSLAQGRYVIDGTPEARAIDAAIDASMATHPAGSRRSSGRDRFTVVPPPSDADDIETPTANTDDEADDPNKPPF
jgi:hypothetical protein